MFASSSLRFSIEAFSSFIRRVKVNEDEARILLLGDVVLKEVEKCSLSWVLRWWESQNSFNVRVVGFYSAHRYLLSSLIKSFSLDLMRTQLSKKKKKKTWNLTLGFYPLKPHTWLLSLYTAEGCSDRNICVLWVSSVVAIVCTDSNVQVGIHCQWHPP